MLMRFRESPLTIVDDLKPHNVSDIRCSYEFYENVSHSLYYSVLSVIYIIPLSVWLAHDLCSSILFVFKFARFEMFILFFI